MSGYVSKDQVIEWFRPYGHVNEGIPYYQCDLPTNEKVEQAIRVLRDGGVD